MVSAFLRLSIVACCLCTLSVTGCSESNDMRVQFENPDGSKTAWFTVELAVTPEARAHGLMFRKELADDRGMLFICEEEVIQRFWMKDTYIPLDMIFIDGNQTVVSVSRQTRPFSRSSYASEKPARYVLEIPGGIADKSGITRGSKLKSSKRLPAAQ